MANVGQHIKQLRIKQNMTQDELAAKLFVSRQTVSNYENNKSQPDIDMLVKVAEALGTDVNVLIYGEPMTPERKRNARWLVVQVILAVFIFVVWFWYQKWAREMQVFYYILTPRFLGAILLQPLRYGIIGWVSVNVLLFVLKREPLRGVWASRVFLGTCAMVVLYLLIMMPHLVDQMTGMGYEFGWLTFETSWVDVLPTWWMKGAEWLFNILGWGGYVAFVLPGVIVGLVKPGTKQIAKPDIGV